tara:strand:+ start:341 stop:493 length:153 start_codon:yes stop_codon:yes gene_type:complete
LVPLIGWIEQMMMGQVPQEEYDAAIASYPDPHHQEKKMRRRNNNNEDSNR